LAEPYFSPYIFLNLGANLSLNVLIKKKSTAYSSFPLNGHILGFNSQTQKIEYASQIFGSYSFTVPFKKEDKNYKIFWSTYASILCERSCPVPTSPLPPERFLSAWLRPPRCHLSWTFLGTKAIDFVIVTGCKLVLYRVDLHEIKPKSLTFRSVASRFIRSVTQPLLFRNIFAPTYCITTLSPPPYTPL